MPDSPIDGLGAAGLLTAPETAGLSLLPGLFEAFKGIINSGQGAQIAKRNTRPVLNEEADFLPTLNLLKQQAGFGLDPSALSFAKNADDNALTGTTNSLLVAGAGPNAISGSYNNYTDQLEKLAEDDSSMRWQKINAYANYTDQYAKAKLDDFMYNEDGPYKDKAQLAANKETQGNQELMAGLDSLTGNAIKGGQPSPYDTTTAKPAVTPAVTSTIAGGGPLVDGSAAQANAGSPIAAILKLLDQ